MNEQEKKILDNIVKELNTAKKDFPSVLRALNNISSKLPKGKIRDFFYGVEKKIDVLVKAAKENIGKDLNKKEIIESVQKGCLALKEARQKFATGNFPQGIPFEIIKAYEENLNLAILFIDFLIERKLTYSIFADISD